MVKNIRFVIIYYPIISNLAKLKFNPMTVKTLIIIITLLSGICLTSYGQESSTLNPQPEIIFENNIYDYGTIPLNSAGECEFVFKNTGKTPLILSNVQSSCGCTVPSWPKEPVAMNTKGVIKVKYNTNRPGTFQKTITVHSNAKNSPIVITIKGTVEKAKASSK